MTCTRKQKRILNDEGNANNLKYMDQPTIVYKIYTDAGSYVGITGDNSQARKIRFVSHLENFAKRGIAVHGIQTLHTFPNRFLALEMEYLLRPERNIGLNRDPGGIRGYHFN